MHNKQIPAKATHFPLLNQRQYREAEMSIYLQPPPPLTWSISISLGKAPGHSMATFRMSGGGGMAAALGVKSLLQLPSSHSHLRGERREVGFSRISRLPQTWSTNLVSKGKTKHSVTSWRGYMWLPTHNEE